MTQSSWWTRSDIELFWMMIQPRLNASDCLQDKRKMEIDWGNFESFYEVQVEKVFFIATKALNFDMKFKEF